MKAESTTILWQIKIHKIIKNTFYFLRRNDFWYFLSMFSKGNNLQQDMSEKPESLSFNLSY